jgi:fluoride exporter
MRPVRRGDGGLLAAVAVGGVLGSLGRYAVGLALPHVSGAFAWSTFLVNVTGSLLIGVVSALVPRGSIAYVFLAIGVMGGFTTYSAFSLDAMILFSGRGDAKPAVGVVYVVLTTVTCLALCWAGIKLGEWLGGTGAPGVQK